MHHVRGLPVVSLALCVGCLLGAGCRGSADAGEGETEGGSSGTANIPGSGSEHDAGADEPPADADPDVTDGGPAASTSDSDGDDEPPPDETDDDETDGGTTGPAGPPFDCTSVSDGPFSYEVFASGVYAAFFAFDGADGLIAANSSTVYNNGVFRRFDPSGAQTILFGDVSPWRQFLAEGDEIWIPAFERGLQIYSAGAAPVVVYDEIDGAGAVARDHEGRLWFVDRSRVGQIDSDTFVETGGENILGLAVDPWGGWLYWTVQMANSELMRVSIDDDGPTGAPESLGPIDPGIVAGAPSGLVSDVCGNLYFVRAWPQPSELIRVTVDDAGTMTRTSLLDMAPGDVPLGPPTFVRGAAFGDTKLYLAINPNMNTQTIVSVDVGVPGVGT